MALGFQLAQQYLLMAKAISKKLLIERTGFGLALLEEPSYF